MALSPEVLALFVRSRVLVLALMLAALGYCVATSERSEASAAECNDDCCLTLLETDHGVVAGVAFVILAARTRAFFLQTSPAPSVSRSVTEPMTGIFTFALMSLSFLLFPCVMNTSASYPPTASIVTFPYEVMSLQLTISTSIRAVDDNQVAN